MSKVYVTMTDKFMSGWGYAENKINKLVFECESYAEAEIVYNNALNRTDQKYINMRSKKPYYNSDHYYTQYIDKTIYPNWYKPGYFKREL